MNEENPSRLEEFRQFGKGLAPLHFRDYLFRARPNLWTGGKGNGASNRAVPADDLLEGFMSRGEGGKEPRKALGEVTGRLNRMARRRP